MSSALACHPKCPDCRVAMNYDADGWFCVNEDCPEFAQSYTLGEIENREEAAGLRATAPTINGERHAAGEHDV